MSLVRWLRKNNKRLMIIVVFLAVIAFLIGPVLRQFGRQPGGRNTIVAHMLDGEGISNNDLFLANQELEVLRMLRIDMLLRNLPSGVNRNPDLGALLLSELLFSDQRLSINLLEGLKRIVKSGNYHVSDKQLNDIYIRPVSRSVIWLLLTKEAEASGISISPADSRLTLTSMYQGERYFQIMQAIIQRLNVSEDRAIEILGKLLGVYEYSRAVCSGENITIRQIMNILRFDEEKIDAEFVQFDTSLFSDRASAPSNSEIESHFDKYKNYFSGDVSESNRYGFGYKLNDRVGLEYLIVKLDDVAKTVASPNEEEKEQYYQSHRDSYVFQDSGDPNDPNSIPVERTRRYWEVANLIERELIQKRTVSKAEKMLDRARDFIEAGLGGDEPGSFSGAKLKELSGDYGKAASNLEDEYGIKIYSGKTGLLDAVDLQLDENFGLLYLMSSNNTLSGLMHVAFSIEELGTSDLGIFDVPTPKFYENIGPLKQVGSSEDISGKITAMVRVYRAEKSSVGSLDTSFSTESTVLDEGGTDTDAVYSVREKVVEDLKKLSAMSTAKANAEELLALVNEHGWEDALSKINELYGKTDDEATFALQEQNGFMRSSKKRAETLSVQNQGNPLKHFIMIRDKQSSAIANTFYSLIPAGTESVGGVPFAAEFKSNLSYYVIKALSVKRVNSDEYDNAKSIYAYTSDGIEGQSLSAVHFNPSNILKRVNFSYIEDDDAVESESQAEGN
ncbi:MAG: hypothetical protein FVQ80_06100 [Planctomycetes bacterium]|nr:hypothetical protein [Planctomycetota bacterium]